MVFYKTVYHQEIEVEETCFKPPKVKGITVDLHEFKVSNCTKKNFLEGQVRKP